MLTSLFHKSPSTLSLSEIREMIGEESAHEIVELFLRQKLSCPDLDLTILQLLLDLNRVEEASKYLLKRAVDIDGENYFLLPKIAKSFIEQQQLLPATIITRALMESLLQRAISKNYGIVIKYLQTLHQLEPQISDWQGHSDHIDFLKQMHTDHRRKTAFWSKVPKELVHSLH